MKISCTDGVIIIKLQQQPSITTNTLLHTNIATVTPDQQEIYTT